MARRGGRRAKWLESDESSEGGDNATSTLPGGIKDDYVSSDEEPASTASAGVAGLGNLFSHAFDGLDEHRTDRRKGKKQDDGGSAPKYIGTDGQEVPDSARAERHEGMSKDKMMKGFAAQARAMSKCGFCPESTTFQNHRSSEIFSMNNSIEGCYLAMVGWKQSIHKNHLRICPMSHRPSIVAQDETTNEYIRNYQKLLVHYFDMKGQVPLFIETAETTPSKEALMLGGGHHVTIEVIPIPHDRLEDAKMSYRESLLSAGEEWAENPKLIDTSRTKNPHLRFAPKGIIPENIPYVHVDFGLAGGFAHIIEKRSEYEIANVDITAKFLREVAVSLLGQSVFDRAFKSEFEWRRSFRYFRSDWRRYSGDPDVLADETETHEDRSPSASNHRDGESRSRREGTDQELYGRRHRDGSDRSRYHHNRRRDREDFERYERSDRRERSPSGDEEVYHRGRLRDFNRRAEEAELFSEMEALQKRDLRSADAGNAQPSGEDDDIALDFSDD